MIVELRYENSRHIGTWQLRTSNMKALKQYLQSIYDKENPIPIKCDLCDFESLYDLIVEKHRETHFVKGKPEHRKEPQGRPNFTFKDFHKKIKSEQLTKEAERQT